VSDAPIPARFYPAGGEAHGHPARLGWHDGTLLVQPEDSPPQRVSAAALRVEARGFNHSQWALQWCDADGSHLLMVDDAVIAPLRDAAPTLFSGGGRVKRSTHRLFGAGILFLIALPLLILAGFYLSIDPLAERIVEHIPPAVERQIGAAVLARTRTDGKMIEQGPAYEALQTIGKRLARPAEKLEFHLVDKPDINAFAAPGGVVVVYSGLIDKSASAEELAGVLAHEIAHVELRHSLRQLVKSAGLRVIAAALLGDYGGLGSWAARLGELKFSRDAEREADMRGLARLREAHIDPAGMPRFFETLSKSEEGRMPALFSTHPATAERLATLQQAIASGSPGPVAPIAVDWTAVRNNLPKS
jgi:beta-barrel assembly-enhancing protease